MNSSRTAQIKHEAIPRASTFTEFTQQHNALVYNTIKNYINESELESYMRAAEFNPHRRGPKGSLTKPEEVQLKKDVERISLYTDRRGNYRRPMYVLLGALLYGGKFEDAVLPAAAQQISEDWILMQDDILDKAKVRRGGPSAPVVIGLRATAATYSTLHALSYGMANRGRAHLGAFTERGNTYFRKFIDIDTRLIEGQFTDFMLTFEDITDFTARKYFRSILAKSAYYTVYGPMQIGAIIAGEGPKTLLKIQRYGTPVGLAFQLIDDVLNCTSTEEKRGKPVHSDVANSSKTLILWHTVQNADSSALKRLRRIYSKEKKRSDEIDFALDTFENLGSIKFVQRIAERLVERGLSTFEKTTTDIKESWLKGLVRDSFKTVLTK